MERTTLRRKEGVAQPSLCWYSTAPEAGSLIREQDLYWLIVLRLKSSSFGVHTQCVSPVPWDERGTYTGSAWEQGESRVVWGSGEGLG